MSRVWLIRHGEPEERGRGRCYGRLDLELSSEGRKQMESVAKYFANEPLRAIYASPLKRAWASAQILAAGSPLEIEAIDGLAEIDFGDFEGLDYGEIEQRFPDLYRQWMEHPSDTQFPNGECFSGFRERVVEAAQALLNRSGEEPIAVVTHGGVIRVLIAEALAIPPDRIFRVAQRYAAVNLIAYAGGIPCVKLVNFAVTDSPGA